MEPLNIKDTIQPFIDDGTYSLPDKDILFYLVNKTHIIENKLDQQITFCRTHLQEKTKFFKSTSQIITLLISVVAIGLAVYATIF